MERSRVKVKKISFCVRHQWDVLKRQNELSPLHSLSVQFLNHPQSFVSLKLLSKMTFLTIGK